MFSLLAGIMSAKIFEDCCPFDAAGLEVRARPESIVRGGAVGTTRARMGWISRSPCGTPCGAIWGNAGGDDSGDESVDDGVFGRLGLETDTAAVKLSPWYVGDPICWDKLGRPCGEGGVGCWEAGPSSKRARWRPGGILLCWVACEIRGMPGGCVPCCRDPNPGSTKGGEVEVRGVGGAEV